MSIFSCIRDFFANDLQSGKKNTANGSIFTKQFKPENLEQSGMMSRSSLWHQGINCRDWTCFTGLWRPQHQKVISSYQSFAGISICGKKCGKDIFNFKDFLQGFYKKDHP